MIKDIKDKESLYNRFTEDIFLFAYHIGDLDDFYFSDCKWFGLEENEQLIEVILLYTGLKIPTLFFLIFYPIHSVNIYIFQKYLLTFP